MKKKGHDQEGNKQHDHNKTTDYKEIIDTPENNISENPDTSSTPESSEVTSEDSSISKSSTDNSATEVRVVEEKLAEMQDKYLRLSAEFDNYRKRTLREKIDLSKYAGENLLLKIIPFMDDFDRAMKHLDTSSDCVSMKDGIMLIHGKFSEFLKQNGVKEIESLNNDFNVEIHEAVAKVPVQEEDKRGKVVEVIQKGYYLQDKVLRFSKVVVGE